MDDKEVSRLFIVLRTSIAAKMGETSVAHPRPRPIVLIVALCSVRHNTSTLLNPFTNTTSLFFVVPPPPL